VRRAENPDNRRETLIALTAAGRRVVDRVTDRRRDEIRDILVRLTVGERELVLAAMTAFSRAAGEPDVVISPSSGCRRTANWSRPRSGLTRTPARRPP
jgi:hypothetical protein